MTHTAPRAEFRVFGQGIIAALQPRLWNGKTVLLQARSMPTETYVLSRHTRDANVKVRDDLLDIKLKVGETPEGYEIFQPSGKFQFPVSREQLRAIAVHLRVTLPDESSTDIVTFDDFVAIAQRHPDLAPVTVTKTRWGFVIDDVTCEYAQVFFNGAMVESACVESTDHEAMRRVIAMLGLDTYPNTNYLRAAAVVVGLV